MRAAYWLIDLWRSSRASREMTMAEQGAYRNLLDEIWIREGPLPLDEAKLAAISGAYSEWPALRAGVLAHFHRGIDGWHHPVAEKVMRESKRLAVKQARYRARKAAERALTGVTLPVSVTGNVGRSKSKKNKNPESDAGARGLDGPAPAETSSTSAQTPYQAALDDIRRRALRAQSG